MAIKAIINNTEKEIEQIKNSDEQDVDYVYSRIGDTEVEGESPISIKSIGGNLADYRICGNTVGGESVGDRTGNLFDKSGSQYGNNLHWVSPGSLVYSDTYYGSPIMDVTGLNTITRSYTGTGANYFLTSDLSQFVNVSNIGTVDAGVTVNVPDGYTKYVFNIPNTISPDSIMVNSGSTALPYEPYGYKVPVTVEGKNLFDGEIERGSFDGRTGEETNSNIRVRSGKVRLTADNYTINVDGVSHGVVYVYDLNGDFIKGKSITTWIELPANFEIDISYDVRFCFRKNDNSDILPSDISNIMINSGSTALPYEPYHAPITTPIYLPEQIKKVGDEAEYIDYAEQKMHRIGADDINVTLPALSTIKGTNTLSVNTSIQPSNIYIKDGFDYKKVFTAIRTIEGESPLNYRSIEDSDSTLKNYRIYGQTVDGESVGDRTGNLFDSNINVISGYLSNEGILKPAKETSQITFDYIPIISGTYTFTYTVPSAYELWFGVCTYDESRTFQSRLVSEYSGAATFTIPDTTKYIRISLRGYNETPIIMLNEGSTALPYEPYGYKMPVTVTNGTDTETTNLYLPEQIRKVGDEAEYIDYAEQKQYRVRKNLLQNTATSLTSRGVTFTVNADGSVTCNGTASNDNNAYLTLARVPNFGTGTYILTGCPAGGNVNTYSMQYSNNVNKAFTEIGSGFDIYQFDYELCPLSEVRIRIASGYTCDNLTFYPMIRKADIEDDTYEPYIENTEVDVTLLALPTLTGTNTLTVGTEVQPSDVYLKGKIKKKPKIYYKIYYYSQDGQTALSTETVEKGHDCTYSTVPTKESDTDFDYTFTGWSTTTNQSSPTSGATTNIQQDTNLYAAFSKSFKTDTISDSWKDIITACNNGTYSGKYQVGDLKTIDVGTEGPVQMQIVAIDTDLLASDNTQTAPITWISKQLLNTSAAMNSTATNYLSDWTNCDMRTYLKNTILPMLPSIVQNNIKEVTKYTNQRTGSTTFTTISSTEDIWLPSYREISSNTSNCETSGVQYNSIFTNNASRVKSKVENSASYWWTRSASGSSNSHYTYYFANVYDNGHANYIGNECPYSHGVAIGFCT